MSFEGHDLYEGVDYELAYENNVDPGTATVVIKGTGQRFVGEKRVDFQIRSAVKPDRFYDVHEDAWYYDAVTKAVARGLVHGYANSGYYGPENMMNRAEAATILCRYFAPGYDSSASVVNKTGMPDVENYAWYTAPANWAVEAGVIGGREGADGSLRFDPFDPITREELCTVIARASQKYSGADVAGADWSAMLSTAGHESVSPWAAQSVAWCMDNGVISGVDGPDGRHIRPQDTVTRATIAQVMMNAIENGVM